MTRKQKIEKIQQEYNCIWDKFIAEIKQFDDKNKGVGVFGISPITKMDGLEKLRAIPLHNCKLNVSINLKSL